MPRLHLRFPDSSSDSLSTETQISRRLAAIVFCAVVTLTLGAVACDDLITEQITIITAGNPTAEFSVDSEAICEGMTVTFTDKSSGPHDQWLWKFGDGDTSTDTAPSHIYTTAGLHTVSLEITDNGTVPPAKDIEVKKRFIVVGTSIAGFTMDTSSGCAGLTVNFTPDFSGVDSFSWDFGEGPIFTDTTPPHTFDSIGVFPITLSVKGGCGVDTAYDTVRIGVCPTFSISPDQDSGCLGMTVIFTESTTDTVAHVNRTWDFGDSVIVNDVTNSIAHTYTKPGDFTVRLTVDNTDGVSFTDSLSVPIKVLDSLIAGFTASTFFGCKTSTGQFGVQFSDTSRGEITKRIWSFGDGIFDSANNPAPFHAYDLLGKFNVRLEVFGPCGADTFSALSIPNLITLAGPLTAGITKSLVGSDSALGTITYNFKDFSQGVPSSWTWNFGDNLTSSSSDINHVYPDTPATYTVTLIVGNTCSAIKDTATDIVTITGPLQPGG